jgi:hypothetical protein
MIKIIEATHVEDAIIHLKFSDGSHGDYDLQELIRRDTQMVKPLQDQAFLKDFFLELGALCWKNGFELSPGSIYRNLKTSGKLRSANEAV